LALVQCLVGKGGKQKGKERDKHLWEAYVSKRLIPGRKYPFEKKKKGKKRISGRGGKERREGRSWQHLFPQSQLAFLCKKWSMKGEGEGREDYKRRKKRREGGCSKRESKSFIFPPILRSQ